MTQNSKAVALKPAPHLEKLIAASKAEDILETVPEPAAEDGFQVLVFHLGNERYAMPIEYIQEIIRYIEPTAVPHTVNFLDGIISLRGQMIPLINGRKRLGHTPMDPDRRTRIIVLEERQQRFGILVDSAAQVLTILKNKVEPPPPVLGTLDAAFMDGIAEQNGQLIILLNLRRFLEFA